MTVTVTIVTLFRDDILTAEKWLESFNSILIPDWASVSLRANSDSDSILSHVKENLRKDVMFIPVKNKKFNISGSDEFEVNRKKAEQVAAIHTANAKALKREVTLFWDDDVTVKGDMVLIKILSSFTDNDIVNVIGVYPDRNDPTLSYVKRSEFGSPIPMKEIGWEKIQVSCGSPGFSAFRSDFLKSILPIEVMQNILDTDTYIGLRISQEKKKCICNGMIRLNHG